MCFISECFAFYAERIAEPFSEDSTLILSDSNMVDGSSDTISSVLSVLELVNDSFSINPSTLSLF